VINKHTGYGQISHHQQYYFAHRLAWQLTHGPIPAGKFICHSCDVPSCVNPKHLFAGTHGDNMKDMIQKGRHSGQRQTQCSKGHTLSPNANTVQTSRLLVRSAAVSCGCAAGDC